MPEQWLTYRQLGELWNTTPEAARVRCRRGNYPRRTSEHGTAEVLVDVDALIARSSRGAQRQVNWMPVAPYAEEQDISSQDALKSLDDLEAQVATLSRDLSIAEDQVETMRRSLAAEREQVSHLMTVLLRGEKRTGKARGIFGFLFFWRRSRRRTSDLLTTQRMPTSPDVLRSASASTPGILDPAPVTRPDTGHHTPYVMPDNPQETRTGDFDQ